MYKKDRHQIWIFNGIVWCLSFVILLFSFAGDKEHFEKIDYIYTVCFLLTVVPPVLLNLYVLMPFLLSKGRYVLFVFAFSANLLLFTMLNVWFFTSLIDIILPDYFFISYHSEVSLLVIFAVFLVGTTLLKLAEEGFYLQKRESTILRMQKEKAQLELSLVRTQLHPHFLFNALNVIYGLALEKDEKMTDAVVQLSDILRYVVYDANTETVPLEKELTLLENYVAFQKNRNFVETVCFDIQKDKKSYDICPMLLLPLVENAFKHGNKGKNSFISTQIRVENGLFTIEITNDYTVEKTEQKACGVGIESVRKNLELVYPKSHSLVCEKADGIFRVTLKIKLDAKD